MNSDVPMMFQWRSHSFDEEVDLFHFCLYNKDIHIRYRWFDPRPPESYREDSCCLKYRTDAWFEFAFFVKYKIALMPLSTQHEPSRKLKEECSRILTELTNTLNSGPLPKTLLARNNIRDIDNASTVAQIGVNYK